ncbi:ADP-ribosylglycohydrolase family protein [Methanosphaerula palustris]|uniref:ADP-ribosylglycohydrolase family protein n=1 Tax=Methanosphaerula palustris TaxID=475088 RepID=UPI001F1C05E8|nr:ADP-ribosylglycohydrolase family protein [Methanosphaerula palustris]
MIFIFDLNAARGAVVGVAIGDALGAPFEGYPSRGLVTEMMGEGPHNRVKGGWTDDTLQMLAVAESLITCRGFSAEDLMIRMIRGYRRHPEFYGPTSSLVFDLILAGRSPLQAAAEAGKRRRSRSNGAVMRGPPIGVMYNSGQVQEISLLCAALTHADPVPGACSAFVNQMISDLCRGVDRRTAHRHACDRCREPEVAEMLGNYRDYQPEPALDALLSTHAALRFFLEAESFEDAVVHAVSIGGDTDTIGAICGALAGACWGITAIPGRWISVLQGLNQLLWTADQLTLIAEP